MGMFEWIATVPPILEFIILLAAFVASVYGLRKTVYKPLKSVYQRWNSAIDTLHGYDPIRDKGTGRVIQKATPPLADRVWELEQTNKKVADALDILAQNQTTLLEMQRRLDEREEMGKAIVADWTAWREAHEKEATERQRQILAFEEWRAEQHALWEMVRTHLAIEEVKAKNENKDPS